MNAITDTIEEVDHAKSQAKAQYESISEMVERLEHCQNCDGADCSESIAFFNGEWTDDQIDEYHDEDAARQAIDEDPLSVQVRSDWYSPGDEDGGDPSEFEILLCTGGPAVRIRGELDNGQPDRAWLEYQDWGTGWTRYFDAEQSTLLAYAQNFYFGE